MSILKRETKADARRPGILLQKNRRRTMYAFLLFLLSATLAMGLYFARLGPPGSSGL